MPRKKYADYIKGIGIILVVLGHINSCNGFAKEWIYAFHMPLFFFATGITAREVETVSGAAAKSFLLKRIKSLLVPYLLWGFIYSGYSHQHVISLLYGSYSRISSAGSLSSLWFLPAMFLAVCAMEAAKMLNFKVRFGYIGYSLIMVMCVFASLILTKLHTDYPFCLNVAVMALAFVIGGYLWENVIGTSLHHRKKIWWAMASVLCFLGTLTYQWNPIAQKSYVLMANMRIGNPIAFVFTALMGCLTVYSVSVLLDGTDRDRKILSFLGTNSLLIFAVHKPVIDICSRVFHPLALPGAVELLITGAVVLAICSAACAIINYFAPCLAGKSRP